MKRYFLLALCLIFTSASVAVGDVAADFTDGNDDTIYVDAYPGVPGNGWASAWVENQRVDEFDSILVANLVTDTDPVAGGGNYLSSSVTTNVAIGANARYATGRDYTDGIDTSIPFRVEFTVRIDENIDPGTTFTDYHDRYTIFDGAASSNATGSSNSWSILAHGGTGTHAHADAVGNWAFYNGNGNGSYDGSDPTKLINTGVPLTTGGVYDFSVTVDPYLRKWDGTVSDGVHSFSQSYMGWRQSGSAPSPYLFFATKADLGSHTRAWSIDSVAITQLSATPTVLLGTVAARFDDGATDVEVDGYPGAVGQGWRTPWKQTVSSSADVTATAEVLSSNPLKPGENSGNYLQVANSHATHRSYSGLSRNYKAFDEGIDWSKEHTVQFSMRIDEDLTAGTFTTQDDRYHASDTGSTKNTSGSASWMVTVCGGEGTYAAAEDVGEWIFYDGNHDGGSMDVTRTVSSEITVVQGVVYDFTIVVDPETQSYVGSVTDGVNTFTTGTLGWRRASTEVGGYLMFDTRAGSVSSLDQRRFSLDDVIITQNLDEIPGDATRDGYVGPDDAAALAAHWLTASGAEWWMGDFNKDGKVNEIDASILAANWNPPPGDSSAVPEPAVLVGLLSSLLILLSNRRRT